MRIADADTERSFTLDGETQVSVLVEIPRGRSYVLVKTDPPATSEEDAVVLTVPRAYLSSRDPELHAIPISQDPGL